MKGWQVKQVAHDLVWHIRMAAQALEHAADSHGGVVVLDEGAPEDVKRERARAVNLIAEMGAEVVSLGQMLRCEVDGSFQGAAQQLIAKCDYALDVLKVNPLAEHLKEQAEDERRRRKEGNTEGYAN